MDRWLVRFRRFRFRRMRWYAGKGIFLSILLGFAAAIMIISFLDAHLEPALIEIAVTQTQNSVIKAINDSVAQAIADGKVEYSDLINLQKNESGEVTALESNMGAINALRTEMLDVALSSLNGLISQEMSVPIGSLTSFSIFSGRGPEVNFKLVAVGSASAEVKSEFSEAGLNQTKHEVILTITTELSILLPGRTVTTTADTSICVAETIIVGSVPDTYLQLDTAD